MHVKILLQLSSKQLGQVIYCSLLSVYVKIPSVVLYFWQEPIFK